MKDVLTIIQARKLKKEAHKRRHLFGEKFNLFEKKEHLEAMMRSRGVKVDLKNQLNFI
jgi:hypothetical protein